MKIYTVRVSESPTSPLEFVGNYTTEAEAKRVIDDLYEIRYGTRPALKEDGQYIHPAGSPGHWVFARIVVTQNRELSIKVKLMYARDVSSNP